MANYDVIVIGAGPAGSASAILLAQKGYRVALLDREKFPRDKVCGEFISPGADPILAELGALKSVESACEVRLKGVAVSAYEREGFCADYPPLDGKPMTSLSLQRTVFDLILWQRAGDAGVERFEGFQVSGLEFENGCAAGVSGWDESRVPFKLRAKAVIDAGGRNAVSLRRLNLRKESGKEGRLALAAHWDGVGQHISHCHMHISEPGYTGLAEVGPGKVNIVLVVNPAEARGKDLNRFYEEAVLKNPLRADLLGSARPCEKVRTVDSLAFSVRPPECGGLLLAGDATGFIDPFTGEGIYLSLRSAQIACETLEKAFNAGDFSHRALKEYDQLRLKENEKKFLLSRLLQSILYRPALCRRVTRILSQNPDMASDLVGVIGDYYDPQEIVSIGFLWKMLLRSLNKETVKLSGV